MDISKKNILLISKPFGITSFALVNKVKHLLNVRKAGHMGTLDPMATGLMIVALDEATRFIPYINTDTKRYIIQIQFGIETDTDDITGNIVNKKDLAVDIHRIEKVIDTFIGTIKQVPPIYSAKKLNGKPLYKYARQGNPVKKPAVEIKIYEMKIISFKDNKLVLDVVCSKGSYMRGIARDLGRALNTFGTLSAIARIAVGSFQISAATTLERIKKGDFNKGFLSLREVIDFPSLIVDNAERFRNGIDITVDKVMVKDKQGAFIGIGKCKDNKIHPEKVVSFE